MLDLAGLEVASYELGRVRSRKGEHRSLYRGLLGESTNGGQCASVMLLTWRIVAREVGSDELGGCRVNSTTKGFNLAGLCHNISKECNSFSVSKHTETIESSSLR